MMDYFHNVPGRLRVRITTIRENPLMGDQIKALLMDIWGITRVSVRSTTGSVIINYDPQVLNANRILGFLADNDHIDVKNLVKNNPQLENAVYRAAEMILKAALSQAAGKFLNGSYLSILTAFL